MSRIGDRSLGVGLGWQFHLALCYKKGHGVFVEHTLAAKYFKQAAMQVRPSPTPTVPLRCNFENCDSVTFEMLRSKFYGDVVGTRPWCGRCSLMQADVGR